VLQARGSDLERDFSFGVVLGLVEPPVRGMDPSRRRRLLGDAAGLAAPLFEDPGASLRGADAAQPSLLHGLFWLVSNLAEERPVVIAVDDVHWADEPSLRFLNYLCERIEELPVALMTSIRTGETATSAELVDRLLHRPVTTRLDLQPLGEQSVAELVASAIPAAGQRLAAACKRATGGNPLLLDQLLQQLRHESADVMTDVDSVERIVAPGISGSVATRLARLPEECGQLARAVAVLGDDAEPGRVADLAAIPDEAATAGLDRLVEARMLTSGHPVGFVHPLVRAAVYDGIPAASRADLHRRAARALVDERAAPERAAAQLVASSPQGDDWAVKALREAADVALARGAPGAAATYLRRALEETPSRPQRAEILRRLGEVEFMLSEPSARQCLDQALALTDDPVERARMLLSAGRILYARASYPETLAAFDRALAELGGRDAELELQLRAERGVVGMMPGIWDGGDLGVDVAGVMSRSQDALTLSERAFLASFALARGWMGAGRDEVLALVDQALGGRTMLEQETSDGTAFYGATAVLHNYGELDRDIALLTDAMDDARRRGSVNGWAMASYCRSWPNLERGRIDEAIADTDQAIEAERYGWEQFIAVAYAIKALALLERDDLPAAGEAVAKVSEDRWGDTPMWSALLKARGALHLREDRPREALEDLLACGELMHGMSPVMYGDWRSSAALAHLALGQRDEARRLAREELKIVRDLGAPRALGVALLRVAATEPGRDGIALHEEAVAVLERSEASLEYWRALIELGAALRRAGHGAAAREPLRRALGLTNAAGATALARRARQELVAAGGRPRRTATEGRDALTPAERRVASLVAEGLTNRQAAQALFVTVKAIEYHLRNVYAKLGISSREELAVRLGAGKAQD
jgi:DNA-binding NarL/FixJ family response regulator